MRTSDTVRITWPNGLIQNETHQKANSALTIAEAQRLSGSCPMIFTWNGEDFEFITDVLGVAPLGASSGDGSYFPVDHDEYIQIPGRALQVKDGQYQIHITRGTARGFVSGQGAVDCGGSSFDDRHLHERQVQVAAVSGVPAVWCVAARCIRFAQSKGMAGMQRERVARIDHAYPDTFRHNDSGVAELHTLDLDFGQGGASKPGGAGAEWLGGLGGRQHFPGRGTERQRGLIFPYLQVKDESGQVADRG